jgi:puromycin-sensitive aminopeptidase
VRGLFEGRAAALGWGAPSDRPDEPTEDDETRLRRAALLRGLVLLAREAGAVAEAERRFPPHPASPRAQALDPNLLDLVVVAAARRADEARFDELRRRARTETDPAAQRRYLHALARVETPRLVDPAVNLALTDEVPMQDFTSYLGVLLNNRVAREPAWRLVRDRWAEVRAKADSPMLLRRLVEGLGALTERRHLQEVRAFLEAHPIDGAKQATAQTLERLQMDVALRERLMPQIAAWLAARPASRP